MKPLFSIIIPVFNSQKYIKRCIESVLLQTNPNFELILIDDGSTDNSGKICDYYRNLDSRVFVLHKANTGVSDSRNKGVDKASGDWIVFIDSDDTIESDYLSNFQLNADLEIQGTTVYDVNNLKKISVFNYNDEFLTTHVFESVLLRGINTAPWAKCFRKEIISTYKIKFPVEISYGEDSVFLFRYLLNCHSARYNSKVGYNYYVCDTGLGHIRHPITKVIRMFEMQFDLYQQMRVSSRIRKHFLHIKSLSAIRELMLWYEVSYMELKKYQCIKDKIIIHLSIIDKLFLSKPFLFYKYCSFYFKYLA